MNPTVQGSNGLVVMTQVYPQVDARGLQQNASLCTSRLCKLSVQVKEFIKGEPRALGTTQIMIGIINILFGMVLAFTYSSIAVFSGVPFWGGLLYIISGSLSVAAEKHDSVCLVKGSLAMNIVSAIAASSAIILYIIDAALQYYYCSYGSYYGESYYGSYPGDRCREMYTMNATMKCFKSVMFFFCLLEGCIAISLSAFGCKATCCINNSSPQPVILMQNPQVIQAAPLISPHVPQMFSAQHAPQVFSPQQTHQTFPPHQFPQANQFSQPPPAPQLLPWNANSGSAPPPYSDQTYMNKNGAVNPAF